MSKAAPWFAFLAVAALAAWLGWREYERRWLEAPIEALREPVTFDVAQGDSLSAVARGLDAAGLLSRPRTWLRYATREGHATRIQAGEYRLQPGTSPKTLLGQFVAGDVVLHAITLPEGWTFRMALAAMHAHPQVKPELKGMTDAEILDKLSIRDRSPEGLFFPDTYRFPRGASDREILRQAHARHVSELAGAWARRADDLPYEKPYEALVLASLVEKETGAEDERPLIAGVFVNRLRRGMRLQTDPAVIYGIGPKFDGNLRRRDLVTDTPYNTYMRAGLPPTPIALVGRAALEAAVHPARTDAMYFVATGLGDGRHFFAETLVAHNSNVSRHLSNLRGGGGVQVR